MEVLRAPPAMAALADSWRREGRSIGFVPTMGALHEGHASLIRRARRENGKVAVSIFVNPLQFSPGEDYQRYPRTYQRDYDLCRGLGVDAIYCPSPKAMYPEGFAASVEIGGLSDILCGAFRPGHFKGVATVVLKLLAAVNPRRAYFGEKDYQQLVIVKRMSQDLNLPVKIVGCPTIREKDGLALSSRNRYLNLNQRREAAGLYRALLLGRKLSRRKKPSKEIISRVRAEIRKIPEVRIDYVSLADAETLGPSGKNSRRLLAAIRLGATRLIDNVAI